MAAGLPQQVADRKRIAALEQLAAERYEAARSLWQQQLRARIDAARDRERVRVQIDADPDDTSW